MNFASLEVSRELHEVSGWLGDRTETRTVTGGMLNPLPDEEAEHVQRYSLGHLLRKLQERPRIELKQLTGRRWWATATWGELVKLTKVEKHTVEGIANTPEDAAAKLAIELFKQGVLTRGGDE